MKNPALKAAFVIALAALGVAEPVRGGTTFYYAPNEAYRSSADSPFAGTSGLKTETFEDGQMTHWVNANHGFIRNSGTATDSVDADDGAIDGFGRNGRSYSSGNYKSITFTFKQTTSEKLPSMAGLVWTDGRQNSTVTFRAWDAYGAFLGKIVVTLGQLGRHGQTAEDRFLGIKSDTGISKMSIVSNYAGFEVDHLQFMYGYAVVPVPPALALGAVGLAGVMMMKWRQGMKWRGRRRDGESRQPPSQDQAFG